MKILLTFRHFPVAMGRFFHWGFQDLGHEVFTVGPYSGGKIPWGDFYYPDHKFPPDFQLPDANFSFEEVLPKIGFKPDIVVQAGDTFWLTGKSPVPNIIIGTDPHVLDYSERLKDADYFFTMQQFYHPSEKWIPYAYDPAIHKYEHDGEEFDVVFCGLQYAHRDKALKAMEAKGLRVKNTLGLIYEEYCSEYNKGKIAFNWSSLKDLPARFWEGLAMKRMVLTSRVPDLTLLDFKEGEDYVGFDTVEEAVEKALYYSAHDEERQRIAENGFKKVKNHTYKNRCKEILKWLA